MKILKYLFVLFIVLFMIYFLGPIPSISPLNTTFTPLNLSLEEMEQTINAAEAGLPTKEDNEARIVWFDKTNKQKTDFVLLYLHGFSASQYEGFPVHRDFANRYGCNLYLSRLAEHGLKSDDALLLMEPSKLYDSAKSALAIAKELGKKVIVMSTSTGGTLSLKLAADFPNLIHSMILYSPNVEIKDKTAKVITGPWGLQIARMAVGGDSRFVENTREEANYWYSEYRVEGAIYLQALINLTMTEETFTAVKQPLFVGYYYKDEDHQDEVVNVAAIQAMFSKLGTDSKQKHIVAFPDAGAHVIACELTSGAIPAVEKETFAFAEDVLGLSAVEID